MGGPHGLEEPDVSLGAARCLEDQTREAGQIQRARAREGREQTAGRGGRHAESVEVAVLDLGSLEVPGPLGELVRVKDHQPWPAAASGHLPEHVKGVCVSHLDLGLVLTGGLIGARQRLLIKIHGPDAVGTGERRRDAEAARVAAQVKHVPTPREVSDLATIIALVAEPARLVAGPRVHEEPDAELMDVAGLDLVAVPAWVSLGEALGTTGGPGEAVEHGVPREQLLEDGPDHFSELPEPQAVVLADQGVAELVDDEAGQVVPLGVHDAIRVCDILKPEDPSTEPQGGCDEALEMLPGALQVAPPAPTQHPETDVRGGVVERVSAESTRTIDDLHDGTVPRDGAVGAVVVRESSVDPGARRDSVHRQVDLFVRGHPRILLPAPTPGGLRGPLPTTTSAMHVLLIETIALIGATVHTMEPGPDPGGVVAAGPAVVLIEDGLIVAVGPDVEIPADAERIELTGLHLVPGLTDGWCSYDPDQDPLWLASGVTTVRDIGASAAQGVYLKSLALQSPSPSPQLLIGSPMFFDGRRSQAGEFGLGAPEQAAEQIAELLELVQESNGAFDYFKHDGSLDEGQLRVVCQAGLAYGVESWGPVPREVGILRARAAGQSGLVGLGSLLPEGADFGTLSEAQEAALNASINDLAEGDWKVAPAMMSLARILRSSGPEEPEIMAALGLNYLSQWRSELETFQMLRATQGDALLAAVKAERETLRRIHEAGIQLVPSSGAPSPAIAPGGGLVDELEEWVAAGIPTEEVLALATRGAAEAVGGAVPAGRVAPGYAADLLALSSDPRRSIGALRAPEVMILKGKVREGFELEESVVQLVEAEAAARLARSRPVPLDPPPMPSGELKASGVLEVKLYGERTATERYAVVELPKGRTAYGARVRYAGPPGRPAVEMVVVQVIHEGLVEFLDMTLNEVDEAGVPQRKDGINRFLARARPVGATGRLALERLGDGRLIGSVRVPEPIAAVEGSMALLGLIAGKHFPEGPSFVIRFDAVQMEPVVERRILTVDPVLHRLDLGGRGTINTYGLSGDGAILFAVTADTRSRTEGVPLIGTLDDEVSALAIDPETDVHRGPDHLGR